LQLAGLAIVISLIASSPGIMSRLFDGKVVLVTGGASGIGRVAAQTFAREGARVFICDVDIQGCHETVRTIKDAGGEGWATKTDITQASELNGMLAELKQTCGKLDFALNNAGIDGDRARTADYSEETWAKVISINLTGVFLCMKHEIPLMLENGSGVIINMSSVAGVTGFVGHSAYTASKHGVIGLTKTAALEYAKQNIRVNAICPCYTRTPMIEKIVNSDPRLGDKLKSRIPVGRLGTAEEVAAAVIYLCSDSASFINGHSLLMDGGIMAE
jgi:NAD(P)-dependent dehydrogenase (short-subunit alcohol dehydrogenase family)